MTRDQVRLVCPNCEGTNLAVFERAIVGYTGRFVRVDDGCVEWRYDGDMFYVSDEGEVDEYRCRDCDSVLTVHDAPAGEIKAVS